ncbi:MAG: hypothetical protein C0436_01135 [Alphaproteobacteria bacterium]|nr:hypothetical protein [Alphaproteobacteria bacterium]
MSAPPPRTMIDPERLYYTGKMGTDNYLALLGMWSGNLRSQAESYLKNTRDYSSIAVAEWFEKLSDSIWHTNGGYALFGLSEANARIPIQEKFNNRLWTHNPNGELNHIRSDDIVPLFRKGDPSSWPNLILTSNHARAWRSEDLSQLMQGVERVASDGWKAPLDSCALKQETERAQARGKNIVILACHAERDIFRNGAQLIRRRLALMEDAQSENPAQRTLENLSPAAVRLSKLILKTMVEPSSARLIDLDLEASDHSPVQWKTPFVASDTRIQGNDIVLREDAARIAQHIKLVGYSRGANTVTDAIRFFYQECAALGARLKIARRDGAIVEATPSDIKGIISNMGILSLAPGEVPLTKAEKDQLGMRRTTIFNAHDLTAGHLINPDEAQYDVWSDKLTRIEGTREDAGHNIVEALGDAARSGYIMDESRAQRDSQYQKAQDEVKAFFASNFHKHAITDLCMFHETQTRANELYVQFAPGISRADEQHLENQFISALRTHGFPGAKAYSDLNHRRRMQVILEEIADPIEGRPLAIRQCKEALEYLTQADKGQLFITRDALTYLDALYKSALPKSTLEADYRQPAERLLPAATPQRD